ncbi:unnamed protein product [Schistosoma rodhaini]|uniref:Uncharacterized protein n=1 Tax=Schistosoma rodhaini TaxID=6188 RepID=A0AA85F415_9TREM|nr:unnamed protein product [Schistosoma rodhaini]
MVLYCPPNLLLYNTYYHHTGFLMLRSSLYFSQGYHVVTYLMGIFLLNRLIDFLSPKIVPETSTDEVLPTKSSEEFRPFLRKLPELKFWNSCTICLLISIFCTFLSFLDVPVFWPILVMYFVLLFYVTMKRQISVCSIIFNYFVYDTFCIYLLHSSVLTVIFIGS